MSLVRKLTAADATKYRELRLLGLRESPTAFGSSYDQESKQPAAFFETRIKPSAERWVLGVFNGKELIGTVGFMRDGGIKTRHKGSIFGMYVHPDWRRKGIGRKLMTTLLSELDALTGLRWVRLSVTAGNTAAQRLYESLGFVAFGEEPEALVVDGIYHAELHMVRKTGRDQSCT